jgi:hypothetical protein
LLVDSRYNGAGARKPCANRQQQRPAAGQDDSLSLWIEAAFNQCLQATGAHYSRQRPTGKGQESLTRAGGHNEIPVLNVAYFPGTFKPQNAGRGLIDSLPALPHFTLGLLQPSGPGDESISMWVLVRIFGSESPPDLATHRYVVVEKTNTAACFRSHGRRGDSTGSCANNDYFEAGAHPVNTSMPAEQAIWQVRRWGTPFTVARHSMQMPMPQSGARGSPLTEKRHGSLAFVTAAATLVPPLTRILLPLTVMGKASVIERALPFSK